MFTITDIQGQLHTFDGSRKWADFINMDCMDALRCMPDKCVELAIVDPPYGININMNMGRRKGQPKKHKEKDWDSGIPGESYFNELMRVSVNQIIWGGNYFPLKPIRGFVVWDKGETMYGRSFAECEFAWTSFDTSARIIKLSPIQDGRIHPTQKPIKLYKRLLSNYAKPGDKILDTHVGSASSLIACHECGFEYIGFELDEEYFAAATERLGAVKSQITLWEVNR